MMRFIFFFLFSNLFFAQTSVNVVEYVFYPLIDEGIEKLLKNENTSIFIKDDIEASKNLKPILVFNKNKSAFYIENVDENTSNIGAAILFLDTHGKIIIDIEKKIRLQNNLPGRFYKKEKYIIIDSLETDWNLTKDTKYIDNYLCYKATLTHKVESKKGTITAWFCPELPYSFGPKGYGGLPGLILELSDKRGLLGLKNINFNKKIDNGILEISGEETITSEVYLDKINRLMNE